MPMPFLKAAYLVSEPLPRGALYSGQAIRSLSRQRVQKKGVSWGMPAMPLRCFPHGRRPMKPWRSEYQPQTTVVLDPSYWVKYRYFKPIPSRMMVLHCQYQLQLVL